MSDSFLQYWKPDTWALQDAQPGDRLLHTAGEQLGRVAPDDRVYVVTVIDGDLILIGRLVVERAVGQTEAEAWFSGAALWDATFHLLSSESGASEKRERRVPADIARALSFVTQRGTTWLHVDGEDQVNGQSLQALRRLSPESIEALERLLAE